jgi:hypothetical protein
MNRRKLYARSTPNVDTQAWIAIQQSLAGPSDEEAEDG